MKEQTGDPPRCVMKLSDGEKLILMVLADMYKHLEIKGEFDPDFISTTISGGHLWGLRWKYTHIPFEKSENPPEVSETVDILDMWSSLEESYGKLSPADNQKVEKEAEPPRAAAPRTAFLRPEGPANPSGRRRKQRHARQCPLSLHKPLSIVFGS